MRSAGIWLILMIAAAGTLAATEILTGIRNALRPRQAPVRPAAVRAS